MTPSADSRALGPGAARFAPAAVRRSLRVPRTWGLRPDDLLLVVIGNAALIVTLWLRHGQFPHVATPAAVLIAAGQISALLGTYCALVQVVLMARSPWVDSVFGIDRIAGWHRWLGFATVNLIVAHILLTTSGYALADGRSLAAQTATFLTTYPYMVMAYAGAALFVLVAVVSVRAARRRLSHESWHLVHLLVYLAIALSFAHQLAVGTDFVHDPVALGYWVCLYAVATALVVAFRVVAPARISLRHRLTVQAIVEEAPDVVSIYMRGRALAELPVRAGQFFKFRFLAPGLWWQVHPFSLSAAPNGEYLRITVKGVGDFTRALHRVSPGTRVALNGPHGGFTAVRRRRPRSLLIAGGIGVTPLRALIEEMPQRKNSITLLYRARSWADVVFKAELDELVAARGGVVHYIVGRRGQEVHPHPFGPRFLLAAAPDLRDRDVFVCGPREMVEGVVASLSALRVPAGQVHVERFAFLS
ncbi:MAG: ferric reductase-like transmembrane domain-containing protein [Candidatus Dormibacteria bacterium]